MCFLITFTVPVSQHWALASAAAALPSDALPVTVQPVRLRGPALAKPRHAYATVGDGCACSLLADDAEAGAARWTLRAEQVEPLASTLEGMAVRLPPGALLEAMWVGDAAEEQRAVTPAQLADIVRSGQLGTRTRYVIASHPRVGWEEEARRMAANGDDRLLM
jgi:hypothetical protein